MKEFLSSAGFKVGSDIFFITDKDYNFCKYSTEKNQISYQNEFSFDVSGKNNPDMFIYGEKYIYAPSLNGKYLIVINVKTFDICSYSINANGDSWGNYAFIYFFKGKLYIFCKKIPKLIIFDEEENLIVEKDFPYEVSHGNANNNDVWLLSSDGKRIISYNLKNAQISVCELSRKLNQIVCSEIEETNIFLLSYTGTVYMFDTVEKRIKILIEPSFNMKVGRMIISKKRIIILPDLGDDIFFIDKNNGRIDKYSDYPADFKYIGNEGWSKFHGCCKLDDMIYYFPRSSNYILCVNLNLEDIMWLRPKLPSKKEMMNYYMSKNGILSEEMFSINDFMEYI